MLGDLVSLLEAASRGPAGCSSVAKRRLRRVSSAVGRCLDTPRTWCDDRHLVNRSRWHQEVAVRLGLRVCEEVGLAHLGLVRSPA